MQNIAVPAITLAGTTVLGSHVAADENKSPDTVDGVYALTCGSSIKDKYHDYMSVIIDLRHASSCEAKVTDELAIGRQEIIEEIGVSCKLRSASRWITNIYEEWTAEGFPISKTYYRLVDSCGYTTVSTFYGLDNNAAQEFCGTLKQHLDRFTGTFGPVSECVKPLSQDNQ